MNEHRASIYDFRTTFYYIFSFWFQERERQEKQRLREEKLKEKQEAKAMKEKERVEAKRKREQEKQEKQAEKERKEKERAEKREQEERERMEKKAKRDEEKRKRDEEKKYGSLLVTDYENVSKNVHVIPSLFSKGFCRVFHTFKAFFAFWSCKAFVLIFHGQKCAEKPTETLADYVIPEHSHSRRDFDHYQNLHFCAIHLQNQLAGVTPCIQILDWCESVIYYPGFIAGKKTCSGLQYGIQIGIGQFCVNIVI